MRKRFIALIVFSVLFAFQSCAIMLTGSGSPVAQANSEIAAPIHSTIVMDVTADATITGTTVSPPISIILAGIPEDVDKQITAAEPPYALYPGPYGEVFAIAGVNSSNNNEKHLGVKIGG